PVEASELLVAHDAVQKRDPVACVAHERIAMGRRVAGERRRGPGHPRLVDQERVAVGQRRPVSGERLVKAAAPPGNGPRIPGLRQLPLEQAVDLRPKRGGVFCGYGLLGPSWVNVEAKT